MRRCFKEEKNLQYGVSLEPLEIHAIKCVDTTVTEHFHVTKGTAQIIITIMTFFGAFTHFNRENIFKFFSAIRLHFDKLVHL